nr:tail fiber protein [uncultured Microbacterium sp.]
MSEPYIGEIRMFAGNFAPAGWAFCDGSLLSIAEFETLFVLIGTTYGGDGQQTFAVPDLRGRSPIHAGQSRDGENYVLGQSAGLEKVTLTTQQLPAHAHGATTASAAGATGPSNARWAAQQAAAFSDATPGAQLAADAVSPAGGDQPHENMPPFLALTYIISLFGIFPSQN